MKVSVVHNRKGKTFVLTELSVVIPYPEQLRSVALTDLQPDSTGGIKIGIDTESGPVNQGSEPVE